MSDTSVLNPPRSATGSNGDAKAHDPRGRFVAGNPGGPGNPFGRQVARLRAGLLASVTEQDIQEVITALLVQAKKGNVAAARLLLAYTVGKPTESVTADSADAAAEQPRQHDGARPVKTFDDMPAQDQQLMAPASGQLSPQPLSPRGRAERRKAERKRLKAQRKTARLQRHQTPSPDGPHGAGAPSPDGFNGAAPPELRKIHGELQVVDQTRGAELDRHRKQDCAVQALQGL